jgi:hypothetical protein
MFKKTVVAMAFGLVAFQASAALTTQQDAASFLAAGLVNGAVVSVTGTPTASGLATSVAGFTDTDTAGGLGFSNLANTTVGGVVLTTGITGDSGCVRSFVSNDSNACTSPISGDQGTQSTLTFQFTTSTAGRLSFQYVFASEEYGADALNDFATFSLRRVSDNAVLDTFASALKSVDGAVDGVSCTKNSGQFVGNNADDVACTGAGRDVEFDGLTTSQLATSSALLQTDVVYEITFTINDAGSATGPDSELDSALFLLNGSFTVTGRNPDPDPVPEPASWALAGLGLLAASMARRRGGKALKR